MKCRQTKNKERVGDYEMPPYPQNAGMAKLVDALDLGSSGATHRSSSLLTRTIDLIFQTSVFFDPSMSNKNENRDVL